MAMLSLAFAFTDEDAYIPQFTKVIAGILSSFFIVGMFGFKYQGELPESQAELRKACMTVHNLTGIILPTPEKPIMTNPR